MPGADLNERYTQLSIVMDTGHTESEKEKKRDRETETERANKTERHPNV